MILRQTKEDNNKQLNGGGGDEDKQYNAQQAIQIHYQNSLIDSNCFLYFFSLSLFYSLNE